MNITTQWQSLFPDCYVTLLRALIIFLVKNLEKTEVLKKSIDRMGNKVDKRKKYLDKVKWGKKFYLFSVL